MSSRRVGSTTSFADSECVTRNGVLSGRVGLEDSAHLTSYLISTVVG